MNLFSLGLTPSEFMAFCYLVQQGGRVTGSETGAVMGVSEKSGRRTLSKLESRGLVKRVARGQFEIPERSPMTVERSLVSETFSVLLTTSSTAYMLLEVPNGTSSRGAFGTPEQTMIKGSESMVMPGRLTDEPDEPRRKPRGPSKFHRQDDPIETWTVAHVVKEFQIRIYQALPNYIYPVDGRELAQVLGRLHRQNGVTVQEMISALESFFADEVQRVPDNSSPMGYFLKYLDRHRRQELASRPEQVDSDFIAQFNGDW